MGNPLSDFIDTAVEVVEDVGFPDEPEDDDDDDD